MLAAIGFSLATYFLLASAERKAFEHDFASYARETASVAENNAANSFGQLQALAIAITSVAEVDNSTEFPFVTVPHFDHRSQAIADMTGAEMVLFVPFVDQSARETWEEYTVDHQGWIEQDYLDRGWDTSTIQPIPEKIYKCPVEVNDTRRGFVDDGFMEQTLMNLSYSSEGFTAPVAQFGPGPVNSSLVMQNLFTHIIFKKEFISALEYDVPVVSEPEELDFLLQHIYPTNSTRQKYKLRSFTLDPVKQDFSENARTIGFLVGIVPWEIYFQNILPENVNGIVVKVESDCGQVRAC